MAYNDFSTESPTNYEQKCLCILVLDVSGSMKGKPLDELNQGLQEFYKDVSKDVTTASRLEITIVTFNNLVKVVQSPALIQDFSMPILTANGSTKMIDGIDKAIEIISARKEWYKKTGQPYYRPWIILMTDGVPDSDQNIESLATEIKLSVSDKKYFFFAIGVQGADMRILKQLSSNVMPPAMVNELKFSQFFRWLSASIATIVDTSTEQDQVNLPNPSGWMKEFKID